MAFIFGTGGGGSGTFTGGTISGNTTVAAGQTLAVATTDKLTCGGVIVPQTKTIDIFWNTNLYSSGNIPILIADETYQVTAVKVVWDGGDSGGETLDVEKLTGTTAPGSGTTILTGVINISGTANTVTSGTLTATTATLQLAVGDRLGMKISATLPAGANYVLTITLKRI